MGVYNTLPAHWPESQWLKQLSDLAEHRLETHTHGDLPKWLKALEDLPAVAARAELEAEPPALGAATEAPARMTKALMAFHPWRKGPICLAGVTVDTEWRSDWKWQRVSPHIDLSGARVLDIGCGNGYFGLRMLNAGARLVVGVDPTLLFVMQWRVMRRLGGELANYVLPLGIEDLPTGKASFDTVFSMGVLYHRKDPAEHLARLKALLRTGGQLVLETLVLPKHQADEVLIPEGRYARMRNVWAVPGISLLEGWLKQAGFKGVKTVDVSRTETSEQRSTRWMHFESLDKALDPENPQKTIEDHPAPVRAVVVASKG